MSTEPTLESTPDRASLMEQAVAAKILSEIVKTADANVRAQLLNDLLDDWRVTKRKSFDAAAFGLTGIGTITLPEGRDKVVVGDAEEFLCYVEDYHPAEVRTTYAPDPEWQKAFIASLEITEEGPVNPLTGEVVPGLRVDTAGEPTKFNVNLSKTTIGQVSAAVLGRTVEALTQAANPVKAIEETKA